MFNNERGKQMKMSTFVWFVEMFFKFFFNFELIKSFPKSIFVIIYIEKFMTYQTYAQVTQLCAYAALPDKVVL